jgi:hypothetical protein
MEKICLKYNDFDKLLNLSLKNCTNNSKPKSKILPKHNFINFMDVQSTDSPISYNSNRDKRICSININSETNEIFKNRTWSITFSSMLSDRYCIQNNIYSILISPLYILAILNKKNINLDKEILDFSRIYTSFIIARLDNCFPISKIDDKTIQSINNDASIFTNSFLPSVLTSCFYNTINFIFDNSSFKNLGYTSLIGVRDTFLTNRGVINDSRPNIDQIINNIKIEIINNGPVFSSFFRLPTFDDYIDEYLKNSDSNMIYINTLDINNYAKKNKNTLLKIPININGWGVINGIEYWECKFFVNGEFKYIKIATSKYTEMEKLIGIDAGFTLDGYADSCTGPFSMSLQKLSNHDDLVKNGTFIKYDLSYCLNNTQIFYNLQNQSVPFSLYDNL